jgi:hypothetical protein
VLFVFWFAVSHIYGLLCLPSVQRLPLSTPCSKSFGLYLQGIQRFFTNQCNEPFFSDFCLYLDVHSHRFSGCQAGLMSILTSARTAINIHQSPSKSQCSCHTSYAKCHSQSSLAMLKSLINVIWLVGLELLRSSNHWGVVANLGLFAVHPLSCLTVSFWSKVIHTWDGFLPWFYDRDMFPYSLVKLATSSLSIHHW